MQRTLVNGVVPLAAAGLLCGCLSQSHVIPKRHLEALSQTPPEQRGQRVRVIQGWQGEDDPPEAQGVQSNTVVVVHTPVRTRTHGPRAPIHKKAAKAKADEAYVWIVVAVLAGVALAATEGARYDGWVNLHPMHPVHLYGPRGEYTWRPLAQIDPQTAQWARKAIVRPREGPWLRLGRAPLNRRGWNYSILLGSAEIPSKYGYADAGFMSHIQFGHFPHHQLGILFDIGLGWAYNRYDETVFDSRYALELQSFPLAAGKLHGGLFAQAGMAARFEDVPSSCTTCGGMRSTFYGGGAIVQLELTTRLTLTGRLGMTVLFGETISDATVGVSIY